MKLSHITRIRIINGSIFLAALYILLYSSSYFFFAPDLAPLMVSIPLICVIGIFMAWIVNRMNHVLVGTHMLLIFSMISVFYVARYYLGPNFGYQAYFLVFGMFPFVFFTRKNRLWSFIYSTINFGLYLYLDNGIYMYLLTKNHPYYNPKIALLFEYINSFITFSTVLIVLWILDIIINKDEDDLIIALEKAEHHAKYDFLTNVLNRRAMTELLNERYETSGSVLNNFAILMIDIDDFKNINDTYGHSVGDDVLKALCEILKENLPDTAILCRWGGEEFIVYIEEGTIDEATKIANEMNALIREKPLFGDLYITLSIGVAANEKDEGYSSVINRADNMMYKAKINGKNKVSNQ